jgi:hypothetical protein
MLYARHWGDKNNVLGWERMNKIKVENITISGAHC